jgi:hypothetical protein
VTKSQKTSTPTPQPPTVGVALDKVTRFMMVLLMRHLPVLTVSDALLEALDLPSEAVVEDIASGVATELAKALLGE